MTLDKTWLVQRLTTPAPRTGPLGGDNPFAFGGGYKNGGLSDDAMSLLRPIFGFDYMGSAEFEFGAVPEALNKLSKLGLTAFRMLVDLSTCHQGWDKAAKPVEGEAEVLVLCPAAIKDEVTDRIRLIAMEHMENPDKDARDKFVQFKESASLGHRLVNIARNKEDWDDRVNGWLELDNGFMFFIDEQMWAKTCALFGVETNVEVES